MKKIIVVNGKFFRGVDQDFSYKRSDALVIEDKRYLDNMIFALFYAMREGRIELRRLEVLDVKEDGNG